MRYRTLGAQKSLERGSASVLFLCALVFLMLPMIGLAIDSCTAFIVKTKLSTTIDAAALAAARSLNVGLDLDSQRQAATNTAQAYFSANFPAGLLGATATMDTPQIIQATDAIRTVTISGSAVSPLYFLRLFGQENTRVSASGQASRKDSNIVLALDRSGSMQASGVCEPMKSAAKEFVNLFANGRDRVGLITFLGSANVDFPQTLNFKPDLLNTIDTLKCAGNTGTAQALALAHQQFLDPATKKLRYPGAQNIVLLFTDGQPNGVSGVFPIKNPGCVAKDNTGVLTGFISGADSTPEGVYDLSGVPLSSSSVKLLSPRAATGCNFEASGGRATQVANDIGSIPPTDFYGSHTTGYMPTVASGPIPVTGAMVAATGWNAADDAAFQIRKDGIVIFCTGESRDVDSRLLKRTANTTDSTSYDSQLPSGQY